MKLFRFAVLRLINVVNFTCTRLIRKRTGDIARLIAGKRLSRDALSGGFVSFYAVNSFDRTRRNTHVGGGVGVLVRIYLELSQITLNFTLCLFRRVNDNRSKIPIDCKRY